jgi:hypothetical protein
VSKIARIIPMPQQGTKVECLFVSSFQNRDTRTNRPQGIFTALYRLERDGKLEPHELQWFHEAETWLNEHLPQPARLSRSPRPNAARNAITWMKLSAVGHVRRMRELAALLSYKDVPVTELITEKPGYVVYEDEYQVAAAPFENET